MCDEKRKKKKEEEWRGTFFVFASCSNEIEISLMLVQRTRDILREYVARTFRKRISLPECRSWLRFRGG